MFESSGFLNLYLPVYFQKVIQSFSSSDKLLKYDQSFLNNFSAYIQFCYSQFQKNGQTKEFFLFLEKQLPFLRQSPVLYSKQSKHTKNQEGKIILEFLESNFDKISQTFLHLFLRIINVKLQVRDQSLSVDQIQGISLRMSKFFNQTRLQYEICRFQYQNLKDFDDYVLQIFFPAFQENISQDMEAIINYLLANQYCQINSESAKQIKNFMKNKRGASQEKKSSKEQEQKKDYKFFRNIFCRKHKKIEKAKTSLQQKKNKMENKIKKFESPLKGTIKLRQSYSPLNRIQNYAKSKKQKPLDRKRTIYFERKNVHVPKIRDWFQKISLFPSESTLSSLIDKKTQKKGFKFQNSQTTLQDFDNESILVRSTPKPNKKFIAKVISHKLDF